MMSFAESFSLVQALLIFHVPSFLSTEHTDRITGLLFLSSIVQIARQVGLFKPEAEWLKPVVLEGDLEVRWKEWIQRETVRRFVSGLVPFSYRFVRLISESAERRGWYTFSTRSPPSKPASPLK